MAIPGKTLSRVSLNLREGDTAGVPDKISVSYEIADSATPTVNDRKRLPLEYSAGDLTTLTGQALWNDVIQKIEKKEINSLLQIEDLTVPAGTIGAYSHTFTAINSVGTIAWDAVLSGSEVGGGDPLPGTLALNPATGQLTGTTSAPANVNIVVRLRTDATTDPSSILEDRKVFNLVIT